MKWDEWRGGTNSRPEPAMWIKRLFSWGGYRVDLHKFVAADAVGCFHSHPATAIRVVLWGGYIEEVKDDRGPYMKEVMPGHVGVVRSEYTHRIHQLVNRRSSWSLWLRGPVTHKIKVEGCE